jgi:hypothetical protein
MELVKTGRQHTLPEEYEQIGAVTASSCAARASHTELRLYNYEEALQVDPVVGKWIQLAHPHIPEDGSEFPKSGDPQAEKGGDVLDGMYDEGCIAPPPLPGISDAVEGTLPASPA